MSQFEYKVVPAPAQGLKTRGLRTPEERFAAALSDAINAEAADGWDYIRAEILPCEERTGWLSRRTVTQQHTLLVFRRALAPRAQTEDAQAQAPVASGVEGLRAIPSRTPVTAAPVQRREPTVPPAQPDMPSPFPRAPAPPPRPVRRDD